MCISIHDLRRELLPLLPSREPMWPHDLEAEAIVLGHIATSPTVDDSIGRLKPTDFFGYSHGGLFEVLTSCRGYDLGPPLAHPGSMRSNFVTEAERLGFNNLSYRDYDTIVRSVPTIIKISPYVDKLIDLSWLRTKLQDIRNLDTLLRTGRLETARNRFYGWLNDQK